MRFEITAQQSVLVSPPQDLKDDLFQEAAGSEGSVHRFRPPRLPVPTYFTDLQGGKSLLIGRDADSDVLRCCPVLQLAAAGPDDPTLYSRNPSANITSVGRINRVNTPDNTKPLSMLTTNGTRKISSSLRS